MSELSAGDSLTSVIELRDVIEDVVVLEPVIGVAEINADDGIIHDKHRAFSDDDPVIWVDADITVSYCQSVTFFNHVRILQDRVVGPIYAIF